MITRLIQLSDPHFGGEDAAATEAAVAFAQAEQPDAVIVTGDLTLNGLPTEFEAAAAWLQRLPKPRVVTPGNHDTPYWNLLLRALTPFNRYHRYIGDPNGEALNIPAVTVRMINTARGAQPRPDWSKGAISLECCRLAVCDMAAGSPAALKVVGCHHPLVEALDTPVTGGVHRGDEAARMLARGNVDLILSGHVHNPFASALMAADNHTYTVGGGTLSTRLRGTPASFNFITADADTITVAAMGWSGSAFTPYRTWGLPRRPPLSAAGPIAAKSPRPRTKCAMSETTKSTMKTTNRIQAILPAPAAMPVNPSAPAISATTKKIKAQRNMKCSPKPGLRRS